MVVKAPRMGSWRRPTGAIGEDMVSGLRGQRRKEMGVKS